MTILLRTLPLTAVDQRLLDALEECGEAYVLEVWSRSGFFCCHCGAEAGPLAHRRPVRATCESCGKEYFCRVVEGQGLVTSSDNATLRRFP